MYVRDPSLVIRWTDKGRHDPMRSAPVAFIVMGADEAVVDGFAQFQDGGSMRVFPEAFLVAYFFGQSGICNYHDLFAEDVDLENGSWQKVRPHRHQE